MKRAFSLVVIHLLVFATIQAQSPAATTDAANSVQLSRQDDSTVQPRELKIPAGTSLEIECAYTVNSLDLHP